MDKRAVLVFGIGGEARESLARALADLSLRIEEASDLGAELERFELRAAEVAAIVLEMADPDVSVDALADFRRLAPQVPVICTAASAPTNTIVTALKNGAADFVCQPATDEDWRKSIAAAVDDGAPPESRPATEGLIAGAFVGRSQGMAAIAATLAQVAWSDAPVLIQGETGSGKEVLARALHAQSPRTKRPFFKLNCAALPSELVESELFGYERGAFTGAFQRKPGIFEAADSGTVLLDEIGDMDVRLQAKLLQVLQDQAFQRIGGKELIKIDVRVIAATHRDLEKSIEEGSFREDLYYRLNVVNIVVPPLRERRADLFDLVDVLLKKHATPGSPIPVLTPGLREAMMAWHWPGNVRELENFARKLLIFRECGLAERDLRALLRRREAAAGGCTTPVFEPITKPASGPTPAAPAAPAEPLRVPAMAEVERVTQRAEADAILAALNAAHWNRRVAAVLLNVDYKCLLYRMKKLGIEQQKAARGAGNAAAAMPVASERQGPEWPPAVAAAATAS